MKLDKNYKVRVTPEQSRQIQELLFALGGGWFGGHDGKHPAMLNADYLFLRDSMVLTYAYERGTNYFEDKPNHTEIQADDLIALLTDLSKSAENPLQDMKLTPEFEAVEPTFKVGDRVYFGSEPHLLTIAEFDTDGWVRPDGWVGFIDDKKCCQATPDNHALLSQLYPHIKFEAPPKPLTGSDLARAMLQKGWNLVPCVVSDISDSDALNNDNCCLVDEWWVGGFDSCFNSGDYSYKYAVPFDLRTGEPLTESILND